MTVLSPRISLSFREYYYNVKILKINDYGSTIGNHDNSNAKVSQCTTLDKISNLGNNIENNLSTFILKRILKCAIEVIHIIIYKPNLRSLLKISCKKS